MVKMFFFFCSANSLNERHSGCLFKIVCRKCMIFLVVRDCKYANQNDKKKKIFFVENKLFFDKCDDNKDLK